MAGELKGLKIKYDPARDSEFIGLKIKFEPVKPSAFEGLNIKFENMEPVQGVKIYRSNYVKNN